VFNQKIASNNKFNFPIFNLFNQKGSGSDYLNLDQNKTNNSSERVFLKFLREKICLGVEWGFFTPTKNYRDIGVQASLKGICIQFDYPSGETTMR